MGLLDRWRGVVDVAAAPTFENTIGPDHVAASYFGLESWDAYTAPVGRISRQEAIQVPAVKRVRDIIAGTIGTLPLRLIDPQRIERRTNLLDQPEPNRAAVITMTRTVEDLLFEGAAWWRVTKFASTTYPEKIEYLAIGRVTENPDGSIYLDGQPADRTRFIKFESPTDPLLLAGARAIRTCLQLDVAAARYAETPTPTTIFTPTDGADPADDDDISAMLTAWKLARQKSAAAYVPAAVNMQSAGYNAVDIQLADARQHAVIEIGRVAGVDPEDLGVSTTSRTYQNGEGRRQYLINFTLGAYMKAITDRLSMGDVTPRGFYVKYDLDDFLKADALTRYQGYQAALQVGAITTEEIRVAEERPDLTVAQQVALLPRETTQEEPSVQPQD